MINVTSMSLIDADSVFRRSYNTHCDLIIPSYISCICSLISFRFPKGARHPDQLDVTNRYLWNPCNPGGPNGNKVQCITRTAPAPTMWGFSSRIDQVLEKTRVACCQLAHLVWGYNPSTKKNNFFWRIPFWRIEGPLQGTSVWVFCFE